MCNTIRSIRRRPVTSSPSHVRVCTCAYSVYDTLTYMYMYIYTLKPNATIIHQRVWLCWGWCGCCGDPPNECERVGVDAVAMVTHRAWTCWGWCGCYGDSPSVNVLGLMRLLWWLTERERVGVDAVVVGVECEAGGVGVHAGEQQRQTLGHLPVRRARQRRYQTWRKHNTCTYM